MESKTLLDYGVSSHSWLLLKRKFVRDRSADEEEEEEEDDGEQYDDEEEEGYEDAEAQHDDNSTAETEE